MFDIPRKILQILKKVPTINLQGPESFEKGPTVVNAGGHLGLPYSV
jgi:hypothetical protein